MEMCRGTRRQRLLTAVQRTELAQEVVRSLQMVASDLLLLRRSAPPARPRANPRTAHAGRLAAPSGSGRMQHRGSADAGTRAPRRPEDPIAPLARTVSARARPSCSARRRTLRASPRRPHRTPGRSRMLAREPRAHRRRDGPAAQRAAPRSWVARQRPRDQLPRPSARAHGSLVHLPRASRASLRRRADGRRPRSLLVRGPRLRRRRPRGGSRRASCIPPSRAVPARSPSRSASRLPTTASARATRVAPCMRAGSAHRATSRRCTR